VRERKDKYGRKNGRALTTFKKLSKLATRSLYHQLLQVFFFFSGNLHEINSRGELTVDSLSPEELIFCW
jgi:hypothetical protein